MRVDQEQCHKIFRNVVKLNEFTKKGDDTIVQIYSGFGTDARVEDLESLKKYRYRVKIEDIETFHTAVSEWIEVMTEKEPAGIKNLNKAIKRDDAVKVRTFMMTEKVRIYFLKLNICLFLNTYLKFVRIKGNHKVFLYCVMNKGLCSGNEFHLSKKKYHFFLIIGYSKWKKTI